MGGQILGGTEPARDTGRHATAVLRRGERGAAVAGEVALALPPADRGLHAVIHLGGHAGPVAEPAGPLRSAALARRTVGARPGHAGLPRQRAAPRLATDRGLAAVLRVARLAPPVVREVAPAVFGADLARGAMPVLGRDADASHHGAIAVVLAVSAPSAVVVPPDDTGIGDGVAAPIVAARRGAIRVGHRHTLEVPKAVGIERELREQAGEGRGLVPGVPSVAVMREAAMDEEPEHAGHGDQNEPDEAEVPKQAASPRLVLAVRGVLGVELRLVVAKQRGQVVQGVAIGVGELGAEALQTSPLVPGQVPQWASQELVSPPEQRAAVRLVGGAVGGARGHSRT